MDFVDFLKEREKKQTSNGSHSGSSNSSEKGRSANTFVDFVKEYNQREEVVQRRKEASNNVQKWLGNYNSTLKGYRDYEKTAFDTWDTNFGGEWYEKVLGLRDEYDSIRNDASLIGSNYRDAYDYLNELADTIQKNREYMSQFDSDEGYQTHRRQQEWYQKYQNLDYNRLEKTAAGIEDPEEKEFVQNMAGNARVQRMRNMDITMAQTDVGQLRRDRDRLYDLALESVDWTDNASRNRPDEVKKKYDSQIAKLEADINEAKRYQKEAELSAVGDRYSQNYDPEFAQRAQFRGDSALSRMINETESERAWRKQQDDVWGASDFSQKGYDRLTQEEKDTYNYWDSYDRQNGTQKAQEYLDSLRLEYRVGTENYEQSKDYNRALKMLSYGAVGMEGALKGIAKVPDMLAGKEDYTPASPTQIAANMLLQDDRENGHKMGGLGKYSPGNLLQDEEGGRTWEEFFGQGAMSIGNMVPSMAVAGMIGMAAPALGAGAALTKGLSRAGSLAVMGAGIAGNTYAEAVNQGYSPKNAKAYAYANAASEIGTELLFGGIEGMTGIGTDALGEKILSMTDNAILRAGARGLVDGLGETVEEGFQAVIEPWMNNVILHKDEVLRGQDVAYNMLAGFATGFMMSGPSIALDEYGTYRTGKDALNQKIDVDALRGVGESFDIGTEANRLAKKIDKNTGAYTIGRMLNEIGAGLGEQNVRDISRYLQNHGLPADVAERNAMVLNYIAMGGQLSEEQKLMVNENQLLADAFRDMVLDQNSKVMQRTQGLKKLTQGEQAESVPIAEKIVSRRNENGDAALNNPNRAVLAVTSREGDTMQLRLKNGDTVDSTDMTAYHDEAEALLFETARKYSRDVADANLIANGFEGSNVSMEEYCKGVEDCYRYGLYGMSYSEVKRGSMSSAIDAEAARSAYMAGIREANTRVARQQKAAMEARQPGQEAALHFNRNGRKFDAKRETSISTMEQLSKALGVDFWVFESYEKNGSRVYADETGAEHKAPNGWYDEYGIHIDLNAGNDGRGVMLYTLAHELTHHIRKYSPEKFKAFADVVMKGYGDRDISAENLIQKQIAKAKKNGRDVDYDTAYEDMIADSMEGILADGKVLEKLKGLQESDPSLWETVKQWAKDVAEKIRAIVDAYKGERMDSTEGKIVSNMKEILPQLEELYAEGLADTRGTTVTNVDAGAKNAAQDGGVNFSIRNTSNMDWKTQIISALKHNGIVRHMDTLVVMKETPDFCLKDGVDNLPMAIPLSVITKAQKGKNADHSISDKNLISLKSGMENAIAVIDNPGRNSFAFITPLYENGGKIVAFFEKNVLFDGDMVHKATSIHSRTDVGGLLNNISEDAVIYVKNKNEFDSLVGMSDSISDAYKNKVKFVYDSLPHKESAVKRKLSDRDPDAGKMNRILQNQNAELRDTVDYLKELVKLQGKVTDGTVYTWGSVEAAARRLMNGAGAKGDVVELRKILERTYKAMGEGSDSMTGLIDQAAQWLVDHKREAKPKLDSYAEGILKEIKGRGVRLNDSQKAEAAALMGKYQDYRRRFFGTLNISDSAGTSLDQFWAEMSESYPDVFGKDVSSSDMPRKLYDAIDSLRNMYQESEFSPEEMLESALNEQRMAVWENFTKLVPIKTVADRNKAQVESIKQRYDQKVQSIRQTYQSQIDQLKQQRKADVQAVRANMQEKADAQQLAAKERYQQQKADLKAAQQDTQIMEREFIRFLRAYDKVSTVGESAQAQADALKNALSEEVKKHKQDNAAWDKEYKRLLREYDAAGRNIDALEEKLTRTRESAKVRVESRKQTAVRNQLKDLHGKFQRMILNPGKGVTAHAPAALTQAVADVCDLFVSNLEQAGVRRAGEYDARIATMQGKLAENPDLKYAQNGVDAANRQKVRIGEQSMKLAELRKQYEALKSGENAIYYDEHTSKMLEDLKTMLDGKDIYDMTSKELEAVKNTMQSFHHSIVSANNIWLGDYNASLTDTARQWGKEINDVNVGFIRKYMGRYLNWQMSPDTFFMATSGFAKDSVGEKVSRMFAKGTERMIGVQQIYYRMFAPILENKNNQSELHNLLGRPAAKKNMVDWGLKNKNGDNVQTTRGMMLMAYMLLGQKDSRAALAESGFKVPDQKVYYKDRSRAFGDKDVGQMLTPGIAEDLNGIGKQIEDMENGLKRGDFGGMTEEDFRQKLDNLRNQRNDLILGEEGRLLGLRDNIEKMLTPMEKQVIDVAKAWFAKSGELMADAHEEVHGYRPKLIEDYVPIHRNGATVWTDIRESNGAFNLENSGFLKERVHNNNAIVLTDLFVELGSQRDAISRYCGFVKPQKDFNRIWKIQARGMSTSINEMIGAKFGTGNTLLGVSGEQYVENFIKDIGGGRNSGKGVLDRFYGAAASKSLSLNPRVAASQLASIPTAAAEVGWKNMSVGFVKGLGTALSTKKKNALAEKNAFFFQRYRGEGGITEVSDLMQKNGLWARVSGSKAGKLLFNWCQNMDVFATSTMYAMAEEAAVSRGYKRGESGFEEAVNEIYTQIIRRTQPNYTVTERSDILRDNRGGMKMLTMFKTQSNQNLNILMQASGKLTKTIHDYRYKQNGVTKADVTNACKHFANASTAVVIGGSAAFVMLRAGVNLIWAQVKSYRDDETGEVTSDEVKAAMFQEFLSSMAGMFTLGDMAYEFIYSAITGEKYYGMTDSAVGLLGDALEKINRLWQNRGKWDEMEDKDKRKELRRSIGNIFGAFGVPAENAMKFVDAYEHWKLNVENGSLFNYSDKDTTDEQYRNRFLKAYRAGDEEGCDNLLAILSLNADEPNERRAAITIRGGFRDSLKDKFLKEEVTEEEVRDIFTKYLDADDEDIDLMIAGWKGKKDTGMTLDEMQDQYLRNLVSTEAYVKYLQDYQGKDQKEAEEAELRLRCERDTGYAYDEIKQAYMDEDITASDAAQWLGDYGKVENPEKKLKEYDFEDETGYSWDDKRMCYLDGAVSKPDFKRWLMDIDGKRSADADYYIGNLDFEKENGYAYNEKLEKYISGEISRQQLKQALMTKGGMFEAEADRELVAYDYIKNHPNTQLSISTAYSYTRKINNCDYTLQSAGFTEEQFLSFREKKNACNGTDNDGDGYRDSGSVQAQVLPIIDAMPISAEQKDTLWFFCGWSKKTLPKKAPWHTR
ncbi:MAG: hypothetical protein MSS60_04965 [Clostridiales bacterium]|nr:hypothetical protein [Clostridiales bacterium]